MKKAEELISKGFLEEAIANTNVAILLPLFLRKLL
jgi:hypothetical protein